MLKINKTNVEKVLKAKHEGFYRKNGVYIGVLDAQNYRLVWFENK